MQKYLEYKNIKYNSDWPFYFSSWTDELVINEIENRDISFARLGLDITIGWEHSIWSRLYFMFETRYRALFAGREFGYGALNIISYISILIGIKYGF